MDEQKRAVDLVLLGHNVFVTGGAGVGKSCVIDSLRKAAESQRRVCTVVAPTGVAALNVNGLTIHSFFGLPTYASDKNATIKFIYNNVKRNMIATDLLIVDEISMVHPNVLSLMDEVARRSRSRNKGPFGGMQVVFVGDFMQLAPIASEGDSDKTWAFETKIWELLEFQNVVLKSPQRQESREFQILSNLRMGSALHSDFAECHIDQASVSKKFLAQAFPDWTVLFASNREKDNYNNMRHVAFSSQIHSFEASVKGATKCQMLKNIPNSLELRVGDKVMVTRNIPSAGLVNGDTGTVESFDRRGVPEVFVDRLAEIQAIEAQTWIQQKLDGGEWTFSGSKTQIPLVLGWAVTIHKAQGATIPKLIVDLNGIFCAGQAYVALSRCTSFDTLRIAGFDAKSVSVSDRALDFYDRLKNKSSEDIEGFLEKLHL